MNTGFVCPWQVLDFFLPGDTWKSLGVPNFYKTKYKKVGVLPIRIVSSVGPSSERNMILSNEGPTVETFDFILRMGSTPTFLYFDLYLNTAYAAHYV